MGNRCRVCGTLTNDTSICNYCSIAKEERRFLKLVNREEVKATRKIARKLNPTAQPVDEAS